jgi:multidrug efflux pump subunit AcrA (membrane-fusion protein)
MDTASTLGALTASEVGTIDTKFEPIQHIERQGTVWVLNQGQLRRVVVTTGLNDGMFTEIVAGDVHDGDQVVGNVVVPKKQ